MPTVIFCSKVYDYEIADQLTSFCINDLLPCILIRKELTLNILDKMQKCKVYNRTIMRSKQFTSVDLSRKSYSVEM